MSTTKHIGSYYAATANPAPARPALEGGRSCDVCVIGAGFTGLSTALHLAENGYEVVVLEAAKVGWGASGRNGGQVVNGFNRDLDGIARRYGEDSARAIGDMCFEGSKIIRDRVDAYDIQCDYKPGSIIAAHNQKQLAGLEKRAASWERHGHTELERIPAERIRDYVRTELYCGGVLDKWGGHLHPMNLALGEAAAVETNGGVIYEDSAVLRVDRGQKVAVHTAAGVVNADFLVVCGNAYLGDLIPELTSKVLPASSQVTVTEPLGEALASELLPRDNCIEDANYFLDYYRITGDKRLLFGGGTVYGGKDPKDIEAELLPHIHKTFPRLRGKRIEFAWSGNFALTLSRVPHMGRTGSNIYFSHGYSGHGVTGTHVAGRLIAEAIAEHTQRLDVFASLSHLPFPGGRRFRVPLVMLGASYYRLREKLGV